MIDLRSDTVTRPCPAMLDAMMKAPVGDDVIDRDPTVERLQEIVAELLGKEAALFMPSGSMANQIALRVHCVPGDEFLCEQECHIYNYEQAAFAQLSGLVTRTIPGDFGVLSLEQVRDKIRPDNEHMPRTRLIALENTHNRGGGRVWPIDPMRDICEWAKQNNLIRHLDGARLFNAEVASGISAKEWSQSFDSVSVCFSKGLGAPIGSAIAGPRDFIQRCRRARKLFGGGMRQVGFLAAAAIYALEHNRDKLALDHRRARQLADTISTFEQLELAPATVDSNIVIFNVHPSLGTGADIVDALAEKGVSCLPFGPQQVRLVTHLDLNDDAITQACEAIDSVIRSRSRPLQRSSV